MLTASHLTQLLKLSAFAFLITSCSTTKALDDKLYEVQFLDEYIIPANFEFEDEIYGGISGVDYTEGELLMVNDSPSNPLIFRAGLKLKGFQVDTGISSKFVTNFLSYFFIKSSQFYFHF